MTKAKPLAAAKAASTSKKFYVVTNDTSRATFVKLGLTPVYLFDDWDASYAKAFKGRDAIIVSELDQEGQGGSLDQIASIARRFTSTRHASSASNCSPPPP